MIFSKGIAHKRNETSQMKQKRVAALWWAMSDDEKQPFKNQFIAATAVFKEQYRKLHNKEFKYSPRKREKPKRGYTRKTVCTAPLIVLPPLVVVDPETADRAWPSV